MCIKEACHIAAGIWTQRSIYSNIIPTQGSPCSLAGRIQLRGSKLHLWFSSIKLEIQGTLGTRSLPLSLSVSVSAMHHYEMCNYTHTKATRHFIYQLQQWENEKRAEKKDKGIEGKKERERGNWLAYHFPCDRHNWQCWARPGESHILRQRNLVRWKVKTG